jgi:light-regulated signal transduction histidine kinase (bacteriophytochrome)
LRTEKARQDLEYANHELEATNRELEAFSYSVSHDLRAPLRSIDGFSQILLEDYADELDEDGKNYLSRVRAASQRMGRLIDDLLGLSRVTRGAMSRERVNLSALAEEVAKGLREARPERAVEFSAQPRLEVWGDLKLLRVALENLIGNAWKFTEKEPEARIEFGMDEELSRRGRVPVYYVRDNGAGFEMAYADKLFGAFQRLHGSDEFEGTGIGLATVQRIVHRHGGRIWAEGEVDRGATFYFTLRPGLQIDLAAPRKEEIKAR